MAMLGSVLRAYLNWWLECVTKVMDNALDEIDPDSYSPVHVVFSASTVLQQYLQNRLGYERKVIDIVSWRSRPHCW
jgi:hypothetical protein